MSDPKRDPIEVINHYLNLDFNRTVKGDKVKGWRPSNGTDLSKMYLNYTECEKLSAAFASLAKILGPTPY